MKCPLCKAPSSVLETRKGGTQRRRECFNGHRFTTMEITLRVDAEPIDPGKQPRMKIQKIGPA